MARDLPLALLQHAASKWAGTHKAACAQARLFPPPPPAPPSPSPSVFALDGGITMQPAAGELLLSFDSSPWHNPAHPWTAAANIFYAVIVGW